MNDRDTPGGRLNALTIPAVLEELRRHGINLETLPGEYRLSFRDGPRDAPIYTDDLRDALAQGLAMAAHRAANPPLIPAAKRVKRISRKAFIRRHNVKVAARRDARERRARAEKETPTKRGPDA